MTLMFIFRLDVVFSLESLLREFHPFSDFITGNRDRIHHHLLKSYDFIDRIQAGVDVSLAVIKSAHVTNTIRKGIVSTDVMSDPHVALIGALSALLAAALWVSFATIKSLPVSTTHSIVGAMIGFGVMNGGLSIINWGKLGAVVASWVISPVFSLLIAWVLFKFIVKFVLSRDDPNGKRRGCHQTANPRPSPQGDAPGNG